MNVSFLLLLFLAIGFYFFLCAILNLPSAAHTRTILSVMQSNQTHGSFVDVFVMNSSVALSKFIKLSSSYKQSLTDTLRSAGIIFSPELYLSQILIRFLMKTTAALPMLILSPIVSVGIVIWALYTMLGDFKSAEKIVIQKRERIERELPRLTAVITQKIKASKDVVGILASYLPSAGEELRDQLEITLAEMRSGSQDRALSKLELRVGSTMMREVVLGLQSVLHGDNALTYFERLEHDFDRIEVQQLKFNNMKRPGKVKLYTTITLGAFILTAFVILGLYAYMKANNLMG